MKQHKVKKTQCPDPISVGFSPLAAWAYVLSIAICGILIGMGAFK